MNGKYPFVTPYRLPIEPYREEVQAISETATTYVATYLGSNTGGTSFNMSTVDFPVEKYTLYESLFQVLIFQNCLIVMNS